MLVLGGSRPRSLERGHTLLEVLVASALLGAILSSSLLLIAQARGKIRAARRSSSATQLASDVMEEIRSLHVLQAAWLLEDERDEESALHEWRSDEHGPNAPAPGGDFDDTLRGWARRAASELPSGRLVVSVQGLSGLGPAAPPEPFCRARLLHVAVSVQWREGARERSVLLQVFEG